MQNVINMNGVSKRYKQFTLADIDLNLPAGSIMGLVGVNGAGKSTAIRILMGLIQADGGTVEVLGYKLPEEQIPAKREIGFASEDMRLYKHKTLAWHMDRIRALFPAWDERYARHLAEKFRLKPDQVLKGYSHGQRVKASLLLPLARRPDLLVLDEPTTGLDPIARHEVIEELADVLRDDNRSVLFSSHNTHDVEQLSDSITFLHDGRVLASRDIGAFLDNWRCVRCRGEVDPERVRTPDTVEIRRNGSLWDLKIDNYSESVPDRLRATGLEIIEVVNMSLEEIFIATVKKGRALWKST
jgi:ABC-2 type transport system ATP-binding protein